MEPKTGKRIVSKGAYVKAQGQRAAISVLVVGLAGIAVLCALMTLGFLFGCIACLMAWSEWGCTAAVTSLGVMLLFGGGTFVFGKLACNALQTATEIDPGVPLTRANTADLPAPDTLVRASSEPVQAQQAVLLRAATEGQETPSEQLVRPAEGAE